MVYRLSIWLGFVAFTLATRSAFGQGYPAPEAASRMTVPEGLEVTLFAAEPMVRQPVCIEFDDRGRMWVVQYLQYPNPAGLSRVKVDRYSRTVYDKMPEPPPKGVKGADRITILEDTDGDGTPDVGKDFVEGLNLASGIAFGHGGVFVLNAPYLLFYPDRNRDDVPDSDPEVCLTGFGMEDAHSVANSLTWGPDGWLYGCQGSTVTANIRGVEFQQGVWRYHPLSKKFELFCEGGGNSWGMDFTPEGHLLYNTNHGGFIMLHAVQGGYYWKSFGKHGPLHNPYAYGYIDHVPHANFQGGHVSVGGVIYHGDNLPEKYRGKFIAADLLDHSVHWHDFTPDRSTFRSAHGGDLLKANDTWFASSDFTMGPDGALYVADWSDQRTAHPDPDAEWDRSNGRVYRISAKGKRFTAGPDFSKQSSAELIGMLSQMDNWVARKARRELANRRDPQVIPTLREMVLDGGDEQRTREALWALYVSGGLSEDLAKQLLSHKSPVVRRWTVRLLGDEERVSPGVAGMLSALAERDGDVDVRSQLASTAKRLPPADGVPIAYRLSFRNEDVDDPHLPLLIWWAVERHAIAGRGQVVDYFSKSSSAIIIRAIRPRLVRRYAAEGTLAGLEACAPLLRCHTDAYFPLLDAFERGLRERPAELARVGTGDEVPESLMKELRPRDANDSPRHPLRVRVLARLGGPSALADASDIAGDTKAPTEQRLAMLDLLGDTGDPEQVPALLAILSGAREPEPVKLAALGALRRFEDARIPAAVLAAYPSLPTAVRARAVDLLLSRKQSATVLLDAVDAGTVPATDVTLDQLRQVEAHSDKALTARVAKRWGKVTGGTPEEKLAEIRRFNNDLRAAGGDKLAGRELFKDTCGACHALFGEGGAVGPDLTHANRTDRNYLLVSIVDPSSVVRAEHLSYLLRTTDGQVLSGLLAEQTPAAVTLLDAKAQRVTVPRQRVQTLKESPVSLMPEGLLSQFTPQQLRDLFAYLQGDGK